MSHNYERSDKTCLNCQTQVVGRFCHVCGQENIETKESFWSLPAILYMISCTLMESFFLLAEEIRFGTKQITEGRTGWLVHKAGDDYEI